MIVMQEFEVYPGSEGGCTVEPCGLAGATEGDTYEEAMEMAVGLGHAPSRDGEATLLDADTPEALYMLDQVSCQHLPHISRPSTPCRHGSKGP